MASNSAPREIRVYYNSACPVCRYGINRQKERSTSVPIVWNDIHHERLSLDEVASDLATVRKILHAKDQHGEIKTGIDAFILLWQASPRERWLARLISLPVIKQLADLWYRVFAELLYRWNLWRGSW